VTIRFETLTPTQLDEALASAKPPTLVDVRTLDAYVAGHVPGSTHVPVYELGARRAELPTSTAQRVVVIGDHRKRAQAGATFLALIGFGDVSVLEGGIAAYEGEIEAGPPPPPPSHGPVLRIVD